jgi:hypothetical protein
MEQPVTLEGHVLCGTCQAAWVLTDVARWSGGDCTECFQANGCQRRSRVEILTRGRRISIPLHAPKNRRHKPKVKSKDAEKAKERARAKLAAMFPELYQVLVADERSAAGLKPWTVPMALQRGGPEAAEATIAFAEQLDREYR